MRLISLVGVFHRFVGHVAGGKPLAGQRFVAIATIKTIPVPGLVPESDSARDNNLLALGAPGRVLVLVTFDALTFENLLVNS